MIKKTVSFMFLFMFTIAISGYLAPKAQALEVFPSGCSSAIGYSVNDGSPCNGTSTATSLIAGCVNPLGYSITNGSACSGTTEVLTFLGGCTSVYSYSTATGAPCNGTQSATLYAYPIITPGLPTTGVLGLSLMNSIILGLLGIIAIGGITYASSKTKKA